MIVSNNFHIFSQVKNETYPYFIRCSNYLTIKLNVMKPFIIEQTSQTPSVTLKDGLLEFSGRSIPEDPKAFYRPIINWIDEYIQDYSGETSIIIRIDLLNTASLKCILDILIKLNKAYLSSKKIKVEWYYDSDDDDMLELGNDLKSIIEMPFDFRENLNIKSVY